MPIFRPVGQINVYRKEQTFCEKFGGCLCLIIVAIIVLAAMNNNGQ